MKTNNKNSGIYSLLIENPTDRLITVGALGTIRFPVGYYVYVGSAQRNLNKRVKRHYSKDKKIRWHIDYFLQFAKIIEHYSLPLPKQCEEWIAMKMQDRAKYIPHFGASDSRAISHLFYGEIDIWESTKFFMKKCLEK